MTLLSLLWKSLKSRRVSTTLTVVSLALSTCLVISMEKIRQGTKLGFSQTISGTDLVVGARSSPTQLLLSTVFQMGVVQNNFSYAAYENIAEHPSVKWTIPIAMGDSHRGRRVLATTPKMFQEYKHHGSQSLEFTEGGSFVEADQTVIGSEVAKQFSYSIGKKIVVSHGISRGALVDHHDDHPLTVVGILKPTGTPLDRTVFVDLSAVDKIHDHGGHDNEHAGHEDHDEHGEGEHDDHADHDHPIETLSAFFLGMHTRGDVLTMQRMIQDYPEEPLSAVLPAVGLSELWRSLDLYDRVLFLMSLLVLAIALISMLVAIYSSLDARKREMAIYRSLGASPQRIGSLYFLESLFLSSMGILSGLLLSYALLVAMRPKLLDWLGIYLPVASPSAQEWGLIFCIILAAACVSVLPFWKVYRQSLHRGLRMD